jgi:lysophospholipase-3
MTVLVNRCRGTVALVGALLALVLLAPAAAGAALDRHGHHGHRGLTPVVLFPAFHFTKLEVTVHHQKVAPECPRSGSFEDWFLNDSPSTTFSQVCQDTLMTLRVTRHRFLDQKGVKVRVKDYGLTESSPFYETMYQALEAAGYVRDESIRVAGYDSRLTPDMRGFVERTKRLIEDTYRDNGRRPVHLVGHSNGPLYAQYPSRTRAGGGSTATSTASPRSPGTSPGRGSSTRCSSRGSTSPTSPSRRRPRTPRAARSCTSRRPRAT